MSVTVSNSNSKKIFVLAGESSGDLIGGRLIGAIRHATQQPIEFVGVGGESMIASGLQPLFPMKELSVMGIVEVLMCLPRLLRRLKEVENYILKNKPDVIVTIDLPDFSFRLAKRLKGLGIPHIHYIAPTVWAWRPGRAKKISKLIDHLLCIYPFEPKYFKPHGLKTTFVGHMVTELNIQNIPREKFRQEHDISEEKPILCLLPGSRHSEVHYILPIFIETLKKLLKLRPDLQIVVPLAENVATTVHDSLEELDKQVIFVRNQQERYEAMRACNVALAASGTVNLELSMAQVPYVIGYKMNSFTGWIAPKLVKVKYITMTNIILDKPLVPEFFQKDCTVDNLFQAVYNLLSNKEAIKNLQDEEVTAMKQLTVNEITPSQRAAEVIIGYL